LKKLLKKVIRTIQKEHDAAMESMRQFHRFLITGLITLVLDQSSKLWLYHIVDIAARQPIAVTPFFDLILVWNHGVSYGMFQQTTEFGRWLLTIFQVVAAVALAIWAWRSPEKWLNLGLGLIAGGAIGNAIDRILYGAVLDFAHLFWGNFSWYVFNIADAAIVAGVGFLLYDSLVSGRTSAPEKP
jgi:signal peptidase II